MNSTRTDEPIPLLTIEGFVAFFFTSKAGSLSVQLWGSQPVRKEGRAPYARYELFLYVVANTLYVSDGTGSELAISFSSTNSVVSAGLTFCYELAWLDNDGLKVR